MRVLIILLGVLAALTGVLLCVIAAFLVFAALFILVLLISAKAVDVDRVYEKNSRFYRFLLNFSTAFGLRICRTRIHKTGMDMIPKGQRYLLVCNHRSKFDPLITWHVLAKDDIAFVSKKENFDVPIFGKLIRRCCFMPIDRENPIKALETINRASDYLKRDEVSVGIYPEGTRNYGDGLLPFHNGSFKIAQKAEVPIVVLCLQGSEIIRDNRGKRPSHVYFDVVDFLPAGYVTSHRTAEIGERVRAAMEKKLAEGDPNAEVKAKNAARKAKKESYQNASSGDDIKIKTEG